MKKLPEIACLVSILFMDAVFAHETNAGDYVVLLHGLGRTSNSLKKMEDCLKDKGYDVLNIDYPSRAYNIQTLTEKFVKTAIESHCKDKTKKIHFVTHSMGGIIVRYYLQTCQTENIGRIVMVSPPNQGSEVVDFLRHSHIVRNFMGPSFEQLSTDPSGFVNMLTEPQAETGVISGRRSLNCINSAIIPGEDDGKVSVRRSKLKNMKDFLVVNRTHPFIMRADEVIEAVICFLETGKFRERQ